MSDALRRSALLCLVRARQCVVSAWYGAVLVAAAACGAKSQATRPTAPAPTAPLPTAGLASTRVPILPLTLVAAEDSLGWDSVLADRAASLAAADSVIRTLLEVRAPEVNWVPPDEVRRQARRSPTLAANPDQMATALLRGERMVEIPDPLRGELRAIVALAGARYALIPAALVFRKTPPPPAGGTRGGGGQATAELSVVLVDARLGRVGWRTVARGEGNDPWTALTRAVKALTPGLP